ncbi:MAG TPA: ABC transporter permease [Vicinamibacterales bacterium]|nr:ABC transporter permease [Vicinamibacterales bacterium]
MHNWNAIVRQRLAVLASQPVDDDLVDELASHLAQAYDKACEEGRSAGEARAHAAKVLDESELLRGVLAARRAPLPQRIARWNRQEPAVVHGGAWMFPLTFARDARYALRMLFRTPAFSLITILTFAVGIGVNTAVFNVVNGVLLRPLPYPNPDQITLLWLDNRRDGIREDITSYPNYVDWQSQSTSYAQMAAVSPTAFSLTGNGDPERLEGARVTANFFEVMQIPPLSGRAFTAHHETPGQDAVVLLSHGLWQRRFGGAPDVVGRTMVLSGRVHEIVGVMPAALHWPDDVEVWAPLAPGEQLRESRGSFWLPVIGRLKPGVSLEQAQTEMTGIAQRLEEEYPGNRGFGINVVPLQKQLVGSVERGLVILLAAVGFVLLIACANLTNLMLGRTTARRKELAVRAALGAARGRLVRQIVTETVVLGLVGAVVGVVLAYWTTGFFLAIAGDSIPRQDAITMDARVLGFALLLALVASLLAGLIPALQASRRTIVDHLREGARAGTGLASRRTRSVLVAAEVALAIVLLTGAGLLIRTLMTLQQTERGFAPANVAMMTVSVPAADYRDASAVRGFYARLLERVRALPGVQSAATGTGVLQPLVARSTVFSIEGVPAPPPEERVEYPFETVSPGYFETVGMTVVRGRGFTDADHADAPPAVVVNETLARMGWPDQDPIGRRMKPGGEQSKAPWMTVVGVIRDAHRAEVTRAIRPEVYISALQNPPRTQTLLVRTSGEPNEMVPTIRRELQALDPQLPIFDVTTLEREVALTLSRPRFQAVLFAGFAGIALLLATIGIYGVTSHAVGQRTQEVGIRMAMGAARRDVLRLIFVQHLRPALAGLAAGVVGAVFLTRFLRSLLFGVSATDPTTFAIVAGGLLAVAAAACWIPARRATRVDPLVALRTE